MRVLAAAVPKLEASLKLTNHVPADLNDASESAVDPALSGAGSLQWRELPQDLVWDMQLRFECRCCDSGPLSVTQEKGSS